MCFLNTMNLVSLLRQVYFKYSLFSAELFLLPLCDKRVRAPFLLW